MNLHPDYEPIWEEIMRLPASLDAEDWVEISFWIFINRLLFGMNWKSRYV